MNDKSLKYFLAFSIIIFTYLCVVKLLVLQTKLVLRDSNTLYHFKFDRKLNYKNNLDISGVFQDAFTNLNINATKSENYNRSDIIFFESYDMIDYYLGKIHFPIECKYIYGVNDTDTFVNKAELYKNYQQVYNKDIIHYFLPETYYDLDLNKLKKLEYNKNTVYIAKKNIQQQKGLYLFNSYEGIEKDFNSTFAVVQKVLQNPFLVGGRKINIRIYLLISINNDKIEFYIYNNGFMYYTPKPFVKHSIDPDNVITTGYIDRSVYETNPLTLKDFLAYLGNKNSLILKDNINKLFNSFKEVYKTKLLFANRKLPGNKFSIYGCDIAPDNNLGCKLIEINKGPDLRYKDKRDKEVKASLIEDTFKIIGLTLYTSKKVTEMQHDFTKL